MASSCGTYGGLAAADDPAPAVQLPAQDRRVELGAGIAMPRDVFTDMVARRARAVAAG